jgi:ADP-heptose:LPS heptosyltransferase
MEPVQAHEQQRPFDSAARRVLVYRLGSLGDMVVALPALRVVARAFPQAERRLLTNFPVNAKAPAAAAVLEGTGLISDYERYTAGTRSVRELAALWWRIARWRPQVVVYLAVARGIQTAKRDAMFFRICGVRRIVGLPLTDTMQQNLGGAVVALGETIWDRELEFEAARLARNLAELGPVDLDDATSWDLNLSGPELAAADVAIREQLPTWEQGISVAAREGAIAVSVGTKVQAKDWGVENWRALLNRVARAYPERVLLLAGAPEEREASDFAAAEWTANGGGPVVNLCGRLSPRESAAALARARIFVGHDSGPMHLAAAVGTSCVAIFAARNIPKQWFPYGEGHRVLYHRVECAGCGLETCIEQRKKCILSITVDEVMDAVDASMSETKRRATEAAAPSAVR